MTETPHLDRLNTDENKEQISSAEIKRIQEFLTDPAKIKELADELKSLRDKGEMKVLLESFEQSLTQHTAEILADAMKTDPDHLKPTDDLQNLILFNASQQGIHIDHTALEDPKQRNIIIAGLIKDLILSSPALQHSLQQARLEHEHQQFLQQLDKDFRDSLTPELLLTLNGIDIAQRPKKLPPSLDEIAMITPENVGTYLNLGPKVEDPTTATNAVKQFFASYLQEFPNYQSDLLDAPGATVTGMNLQNMSQRLTYSRDTRELYLKTNNKSDTIFKTGQLPPELQNAYLGPDALKVMIKEHLISLATPEQQSDFQVFLYEQTRGNTPLGLMLKQINDGSKATNSAPFLKQLLQSGYDIKTIRMVGETGEKFGQQLVGASKIQQIASINALRTQHPDIYKHPVFQRFRDYVRELGEFVVDTNKAYKPLGLQLPTGYENEKSFDAFIKGHADFARSMKSLAPGLKDAQVFLNPTADQSFNNAQSGQQAQYYGKIAFEKKYHMTVDQLMEKVKNAQMEITSLYVKTLLLLKPQPAFVTLGQKIESPFMPGMTLDFSKKTHDAIIRNTFFEQGADGWNQFADDIKNNPAKAFANVMACIAGAVAITFFRNPLIGAPISAATFRLTNGLTQGFIQGIYHGDFQKGLRAFGTGVGAGSENAQGEFTMLSGTEIVIDFAGDALEAGIGKVLNPGFNKILGAMTGTGKGILSTGSRVVGDMVLNDIIGEIGAAQFVTNPLTAYLKNLSGNRYSVMNGLTSRNGRGASESAGGAGTRESASAAARESFGRDLQDPNMLVQMLGYSVFYSSMAAAGRQGTDIVMKRLPPQMQQAIIANGDQIAKSAQKIEQALSAANIRVVVKNGVAALQDGFGKRYASVDAVIGDHPNINGMGAEIKNLSKLQQEGAEILQRVGDKNPPDSLHGREMAIANALGLSGSDMSLDEEADQKGAILEKQGKSEQAKKYKDAANELKHIDQRIKDGMGAPIQTLKTAGIQKVAGVSPDGIVSTGVDLSKNALNTADQQTVDVKKQTEATTKTTTKTETTETIQAKEKSAEQQAIKVSLGIDVQMDMITTREQASELETKLNAIISNKLLSVEAKSLAQEKLVELQVHTQTLPVTAPGDQKSAEPKVILLKPQSLPSQQTGTDG